MMTYSVGLHLAEPIPEDAVDRVLATFAEEHAVIGCAGRTLRLALSAENVVSALWDAATIVRHLVPDIVGADVEMLPALV